MDPDIDNHAESEAGATAPTESAAGATPQAEKPKGKRQLYKTCILYARLSKDDGGSHSIEAQLHAMRKWCASGAYEIAGTYQDVGVSGTVAPRQRPECAKAIDHALKLTKQGKRVAFVVARLDRLSRSLRDALNLVQGVFIPKRIVLQSVGERLGKGSDGLFAAQLYLAMAERERQLISERTKAAHSERARKGLLIGGDASRIPFGWRQAGAVPAMRRKGYVGTDIIIEPDIKQQRILNEARALSKIMKQKDGAPSWYKIAREMNERGYRTSHGKLFDREILARMIATNERLKRERRKITEEEKVRLMLEQGEKPPAKGEEWRYDLDHHPDYSDDWAGRYMKFANVDGTEDYED